MQVIIIKMVSLLMPAIVFISRMFPALFNGKEYINPEGDGVTVIEQNVSKDGIIINDSESFKSLGDIGINYEEDFFDNNSLAIVTAEYQEGDEFYVKSIYTEDSAIKVEYVVITKGLAAAMYSPAYKTFIIETDKSVKNISAEENDINDKINSALIELYRKYAELG